MKFAKRVTLHQSSLIFLVLSLPMCCFTILCFRFIGELRSALDLDTQMGMFGILGIFELLRCGMSYLIFWLFQGIGKICFWNGLAMLFDSILGLIVSKIHTYKAFCFQERCNWLWIVLLMLKTILPEIMNFQDGITETALKRLLISLLGGILLNLVPIQFIAVCREECSVLKAETDSGGSIEN